MLPWPRGLDHFGESMSLSGLGGGLSGERGVSTGFSAVEDFHRVDDAEVFRGAGRSARRSEVPVEVGVCGADTGAPCSGANEPPYGFVLSELAPPLNPIGLPGAGKL